MKEVNKINKIYQGFFGEKLPEDITESRRSKCATCQFNSTNNDTMSLIGNIRNSFTGPFCTLCDCQIEEKTSSSLEECALGMIGEDKKWFKIKIETMSKSDLNMIQNGETHYDIALEDSIFVVNFSEINNSSVVETELIFENNSHPITLKKTLVSCGCTLTNSSQLDMNRIAVRVKLDPTKVSLGSGAKSFTIEYEQQGVKKSQKVKLKYFKTN